MGYDKFEQRSYLKYCNGAETFYTYDNRRRLSNLAVNSGNTAIMKWAKGQKHIQTMQYFFLPFYPVLRLLGQANNMREIVLSQLVLARDGFEKFAVSPKDISSLAKKYKKNRY